MSMVRVIILTAERSGPAKSWSCVAVAKVDGIFQTFHNMRQQTSITDFARYTMTVDRLQVNPNAREQNTTYMLPKYHGPVTRAWDP